ncbi:MAG: hypothetical protein RJA70_3242 [Pseudomonadota bacterium]|jgi:glutaminyl-tRNA synthetase
MSESAPQNFIRALIQEDLAADKHGGKVVTRFPPEPNGYLHIGHAKSICLNFGIARDIPGAVCHLRFDDTNPLTEDTEYVSSIQEDVRWLGFEWADKLFYASDYFERIYQFAEELISQGKAYVCSLTEAQVKEYRGSITEPGRPSPDRDRPVAENLDLFRRMRAGEFKDGELVLRAKIDLGAANMKLRDPAIYRIRHTHHHRTLDKWCIYPLYDFTHCLSDSLEHITHSLCTLEFESARALYDWVLDTLDVPSRPHQFEFAKLGLNYTVLSKRNLRAMVTEGIVLGWDDPRMPTLSGLRRRGYTPSAIRSFCERIGVAKSNSTAELSLLEHCVREDLSPEVPRVLAVLEPLLVTITNYPEGKTEQLTASSFPEDVPKTGSRQLPFSRQLYIDGDDFREDPPQKYHRLAPGREVRLRHAYVIRCDEVKKDATGRVVELLCHYDPDTLQGPPADGRKIPGTIHWVSQAHALPAEVRLYERLFSVEDPTNGDFRDYLNSDSLLVRRGYVEPSVAALPSDTRYQFERLGFFWQDPIDSKPGALVFNRVVSLKDSWSKIVESQTQGQSGVQALHQERRRARDEQKSLQAALQKAKPVELDEAARRYHEAQGLPVAQAVTLSGNMALAAFFDTASAGASGDALLRGALANWVVTEVARELKEGTLKFNPKQLLSLVEMTLAEKITARAAKDVFAEMARSGEAPEAVVSRLGLEQVSDSATLQPIVDEVLAALPDKVAAYRSGNQNLLGLFMGQVMKRAQGADPKVLGQLLKKSLEG